MSLDAQASITDGGDLFDPKAIRRRLPNDLTDKQERALICAVRNPDAPLDGIGEATAVSHEVVRNGLESLARDLGGNSRPKEWAKRRDGPREAENYDELTEKQRHVIDFLARHPEFDYHERTSRELRNAMRSYYGEDMPDMHYTYPKRVATREYEGLIEARRRELLSQGEELEGEVDEVDVSDEVGLTPREWLGQAGIKNLPESNLDSLDEAAGALDPEERLEVAYQNGQRDDDPEVDRDDYLAPLSCPKCSLESNGSLVCPKCGADKRFDEDRPPREAHYGENVSVDEFERGVIYFGNVSGIADYGLFVSVGGQSGHLNEVSGLLHESNMPVSEPTDLLDGVNEGDSVPVVVVGRKENDRGETKLNLAWPTQGRVEDYLDDEAGEDGTEVEFEQASDLDRGDGDDEGEDAQADEQTDTDDTTMSADTDESDEGRTALDEMDALEAEVSALRETVEGLLEWAEAPADDRDDREVPITLPGIVERLESLEETVQGESGAQDDLDRAVSETLRDVRERLGAVESDLDAAPTIEQIEVLAERESDLTDRLDELEDEHESLTDWVRRLDRQSEDALDSLESSIDSVGSNVAGAHERINELAERLDELEDATLENGHRVAGTESVHGDMLESHEERLEALEDAAGDDLGLVAGASDPQYAAALRFVKDALEDGYDIVGLETETSYSRKELHLKLKE